MWAKGMERMHPSLALPMPDVHTSVCRQRASQVTTALERAVKDTRTSYDAALCTLKSWTQEPAGMKDKVKRLLKANQVKEELAALDKQMASNTEALCSALSVAIFINQEVRRFAEPQPGQMSSAFLTCHRALMVLAAGQPGTKHG